MFDKATLKNYYQAMVAHGPRNESALKNSLSTRTIYPWGFAVIELCFYTTRLMNSPACTRLLHPRCSNNIQAQKNLITLSRNLRL